MTRTRWAHHDVGLQWDDAQVVLMVPLARDGRLWGFFLVVSAAFLFAIRIMRGVPALSWSLVGVFLIVAFAFVRFGVLATRIDGQGLAHARRWRLRSVTPIPLQEVESLGAVHPLSRGSRPKARFQACWEIAFSTKRGRIVACKTEDATLVRDLCIFMAQRLGKLAVPVQLPAGLPKITVNPGPDFRMKGNLFASRAFLGFAILCVAATSIPFIQWARGVPEFSWGWIPVSVSLPFVAVASFFLGPWSIERRGADLVVRRFLRRERSLPIKGLSFPGLVWVPNLGPPIAFSSYLLIVTQRLGMGNQKVALAWPRPKVMEALRGLFSVAEPAPGPDQRERVLPAST